MKHDPIVLDEHRGMAAQQATEIRRRLAEVETDQAALRERRTELEKFLLAAPASTWLEAADKARYLIGLFAATSIAQDPRRRKLIAGVLGDFSRLSAEPAAEQLHSGKSDAGGQVTFASEVLLGRIAAFYGFSIPEAENETSLAEFVRARLQGEPKLGDHISFADKKLVIQGMDGERITKVGLELKFAKPVLPS
jgi:hypothetical protein